MTTPQPPSPAKPTTARPAPAWATSATEITVTDGLRGEHAVLGHLVDLVAEAARTVQEVGRLQDAALMLEGPLVKHAHTEEELLLQPLERHLGAIPPVQVMRMEHEEIERQLHEILAEGHEEIEDRFRRLRGPVTLAEARRMAEEMVALVRDHFTKEERIVFPLADGTISPPELRRLGRLWSGQRSVSAW